MPARLLGAGLMHFLRPRPYVAIVPVADAERFRAVPEPLLWARLPVHGLLIAWLWRVAVR